MIARWNKMISAWCVAALAVACSNPVENPARPAEVGRFASPNPGSVNVFWMLGPRGFVVIDTGRNVAGGRRVVEEIRRTGQPVVAVLITHPHPDHVGGLGVLREAYPLTPIYASQATGEYMRADPLMFYNLARRDDADYPAKISYPTQAFSPGASLELGGIRFDTAQFGPGDQLRNRFPGARTIYPGHGEAGKPGELIQAQQTYLQTLRRLVRPAVSASSPGGKSVSVEERTSIIAELERRYPGYPRVAALPNLQKENVAGVARELTAENPSSLPSICR